MTSFLLFCACVIAGGIALIVALLILRVVLELLGAFLP